MASKPNLINPPRNGVSSRATGSVTLADVAKIAGVSPITVSRVVNRPELVTPDTLAHVQQVIERTGYVTEATANANLVLSLQSKKPATDAPHGP